MTLLELWGITSYYLGSYLGTSGRLVITNVGVDTNRTRINEEGRGGETGVYTRRWGRRSYLNIGKMTLITS